MFMLNFRSVSQNFVHQYPLSTRGVGGVTFSNRDWKVLDKVCDIKGWQYMEWSDKTTPVDQGRATWWRKWDHDCNRLVIVYLMMKKWGANSKSFRIPRQSLDEFVDTWSLILRKWCSLKSSMSQWCSIYFLFDVCLKKSHVNGWFWQKFWWPW